MVGPRYRPAGESALVVEFGATADPAFHARVLALDAALAAHPIEGVRESVPTYRSLMVHFDPRRITFTALAEALDAATAAPIPGRPRRRWRVPVCYDPPYAEDLREVADALGLTPDDVASLHVDAIYRVVMYGFAPGFVFLAGLPDALAISRRRTPRLPAAPGALTIANGQALIASIAMPTGWYVLGRTPARTFDPARVPMFPIAVGDEVGFERIDGMGFERLVREGESGAEILKAS